VGQGSVSQLQQSSGSKVSYISAFKDRGGSRVSVSAFKDHDVGQGSVSQLQQSCGSKVSISVFEDHVGQGSVVSRLLRIMMWVRGQCHSSYPRL
jgi:hypothetical protein